MTVYLKDRVKQVTSTTGTGTITFSNTPSGYQSFSSAYNDGDEVYYVIENRSDYEIGVGTYVANTLSRNTVLKSSNGGAKLSLTGQSTVFVSVPAEKFVYIDGVGQSNINLDRLSDVVITAPASGEGLKYNGTNWVNGNISVYTDEQAQDAVAGMLIGSTGINVSYNDGTNTLTIAATGLLSQSNNLSDLTNVSTARTNLGLGSAALSNSGDFYLSTNPSGYISAASVAAGYQPLDGDLTSIAAATGVNTIYYRSASNTWSPVVIGSGLVFNSGTLANTLDLSPYATIASVASTYVPLTRTITINGSGLDLTSNRSWTVGDLRSDSTYSNPTWLTSLAWSKISGTPTTLAGYGITDGITSAAVAAGYQPLDSDLTSIAALTTTSYGRSLLTQADAPTARTTLGLGTLATQNGTFSGTSSGTNTGDQTITLTGDVTGTGTGSFATTISAGAVTNSMLAGSIAISKLAITGTPDGTKFLRDDGTWQTVSGGSSGITSINGDTTAAQLLTVGTSGTDFNIDSTTTSGTSVFNIPDASASARGLVTTGAQTWAGAKTFSTSLSSPTLSLTNDSSSSAGLNFVYSTNGGVIANNGTRAILFNAGGITLGSNTFIDNNIRFTVNGFMTGASNALDIRNSTNAQTVNISNTYTSSTSFEYGRFQWASNQFRIGSAIGSAGGSSRQTVFGRWDSAGVWTSLLTLPATGSAITMQGGGATFTVDTASQVVLQGSFNLSMDSSSSVASHGRCRLTLSGTNATFSFLNTSFAEVDGNVNFGGTTASYVGLRRSGTTLQVRLADNSAAAPISASAGTFASGTITSSNPGITLTQAWNSGATTFTGMLVNVTDTASNASSLLMDLQVGGVSRMSLEASSGKLSLLKPNTAGFTLVPAIAIRAPVNASGTRHISFYGPDWTTEQGYIASSAGHTGLQFVGTTVSVTDVRSNYGTPNASQLTAGGLRFASGCSVGWGTVNSYDTPDLTLFRDAANTLAQRNGTNAQTFRVYNTFTSATNAEWFQQSWASNEARIGTAVGSAGGTVRDIVIGTWDSAGNFTTGLTITRATLSGEYLSWRGGSSGSATALSLRVSGVTNYIYFGGNVLCAGGTSVNNNITFYPPLRYVPNARTSGAITEWQWTAAAHTGQTASTEASSVVFDLSATKTFAAGALTTQRAFRIQAPTYAFASASTISTAVTLDVSGAPIAGTNATITYGAAIRAKGAIALGDGTETTATASKLELFSNQPTPSAYIKGGVNAVGYLGQVFNNMAWSNSGVTITGNSDSVGYRWVSNLQTDSWTLTAQLVSPSANTISQVNGTNAQTFRVYNTYTSATNAEWYQESWVSNEIRLGTAVGSVGGTQRAMSLGSWDAAGSFTTAMTINTAGTVTVGAYTLPATDGTNGQVLQTDGAGTVTWATVSGGGGGGGGITELNGLTGATQTFAVGTSGTDFAISSTGTTHTFNIPDASASARGLVTTGAQTFAGDKTFTGLPLVTYANSGTTLGGASGIPYQGLAVVNSNGGTSGNPFGILFGGTTGYHHSAIFGIQQFDVNNRSGDLVIATRPQSSDSSLTEAVRIYYDGILNVGRTPSSLVSGGRIWLNTRGTASITNLTGIGSVNSVGEGIVAQNAGSAFAVYGPYTGTTWTAAGGMKAAKTNATDGDYGFDLTFHTRVNGGNATEKMRITTDGALAFLNDTFTQRRSTNAQTFNIANTYTSSTSFEYGRFQWASNEFRIGTAVGSAGGTQRDIVLGNYNSAGTWTPAITLGASGINTVRLDNTYCYINSSNAGYSWNLYTRYGQIFSVANNGICHVQGSFTLTDNTYGPQIQYTTSVPGRGNFGATPTARAWLVGGSGGSYASSTNRHHGVGWAAWCGVGATPSDTNANGGNAGTFDIWLNAGGPGNGTGAAGSDGKFRIVNDATDTEVFSIDVSGNLILTTTNGSKIGTSATQKLGFWNATPVVQNTGWSTSNSSSRKTIDATATNLNELIDLVCTLVETLKSYGIIGA